MRESRVFFNSVLESRLSQGRELSIKMNSMVPRRRFDTLEERSLMQDAVSRFAGTAEDEMTSLPVSWQD